MKFVKLFITFLAITIIANITNVLIYANSYSISVENTNDAVSINGNQYNAYLLFESVENNDGAYFFNPETCLEVSYTPEGEDMLSEEELLKWLSDPSRTDSELYDFSTHIYNNFIDVDPAVTPTGSGTAVGQHAEIPLNIAGYYVVAGKGERADNHSPITALVSLTVVNPTATIHPKLDVPSLEKFVYHENDDAFTKYSDHAVGDNVIYQIQTTVPITTGYTEYSYIITDTLDEGLTFNNDLILKAEVSSGTITIPNSYYTVTDQSPLRNSFTVDIDILSLVNDEIISSSDKLISGFSATLNENAVINPSGTNDNSASLSYSNNPQNASSTGTTPTSVTESTSFKVNIVKLNSASTQLEGAEFCITLDEKLTTDAHGNPTNALSFIKNSDSEYIMAPSSYDNAKTAIITAGSVDIIGLNSDVKYYLHEITPPTGYVLNTAPRYFSLIAEYDEHTGELLPGYPNLLINSEEASSLIIEVINYTESNLPDTGENSKNYVISLGIMFSLIGIGLLTIKIRDKNAKY